MGRQKHIYLRTARERHGWTQKRLAQISGIGQTVISRLETAPSYGVSYTTVAAIANALGIPLGELRLGPDPAVAPTPTGRRRKAREAVA